MAFTSRPGGYRPPSRLGGLRRPGVRVQRPPLPVFQPPAQQLPTPPIEAPSPGRWTPPGGPAPIAAPAPGRGPEPRVPPIAAPAPGTRQPPPVADEITSALGAPARQQGLRRATLGPDDGGAATPPAAPPAPIVNQLPPGFGGGQTQPANVNQANPGAQNPFSTDPGYLAALAAEQAGSQQADAALRAAQEAAIVGYGDPSIAASLGFDLDPATAAAARANYLAGNSSLARLDKTRDLNRQGSINNLAAHGIIFSGETGYQRGQIDQNYGNQVYDTQQALLAALQGASAQDVAAKQNLHSGTVNALTGAYDRYAANPGLYAGAAGIPAAKAATVAGQLAPKTATPLKKKPVKAPLVNPYTTGQKRYG